eukprot:EG_transcript_21770
MTNCTEEHETPAAAPAGQPCSQETRRRQAVPFGHSSQQPALLACDVLGRVEWMAPPEATPTDDGKDGVHGGEAAPPAMEPTAPPPGAPSGYSSPVAPLPPIMP